jgi:hypothetical protein
LIIMIFFMIKYVCVVFHKDARGKQLPPTFYLTFCIHIQLFCRVYFYLVINAVLEFELYYFLIDKLVLLDFEGVCLISIISLSQSLVQ